ncbi:MAG: NAD+ synthase [Haloferacaceae archaeon]
MVDVPAAVATMRRFLDERLEAADADGYVLGVSGGLDSTVAAHLAVDAVGAERVVGMVMPDEPNLERNMRDARALCDDLGVERREADIRDVVSAVLDAVPYDPGRVATGNVRARTRMVLEYLEANHGDRLVLGAGNRSERALGYFTKYGDGAVDVQPMGDLYKTEVVAVARHLGVDERFVEKQPTAGLWPGQTDEGELEASYDTIDRVLKRLVDGGQPAEAVAAETGVDLELVRRFERMWRSSEHKRRRPPTADVGRDAVD